MKILLMDDHALFRAGMHYVLRQMDEQVLILDANSLQAALECAEQNPDLDLALLDLSMPDNDGLTSVKLFHARYSKIPIVVVSGTTRRGEIEQVMKSGVHGFIHKSSTSKVMVKALRMVLDGGIYVPPQLAHRAVPSASQVDRRRWRSNEFGMTLCQVQVLQYLAQGMSNRDIADAIGLAEGTVKVNLAAVFHALRVNNRMEAVHAGQRFGLIPG